MPRVLNKHTDEIPIDAVYVGRGSTWGNPYRITSQVSREKVCADFETYILPTLDLTKLRGKDLICYCAPKQCHADILLREANK